MASARHKDTLLSLKERVQLVEESYKNKKQIEVIYFDMLLVDLLLKKRCQIVIRGLRNTLDFEYEKQMSEVNSTLSFEVNTVFFMAKPAHQLISSSLIRQLVQFDLSHIEPFVTPNVLKILSKKA